MASEIASTVVQLGWIPEGPVAYELFGINCAVNIDNRGGCSISEASVVPFRLNGTSRTQIPVNQTGSEHVVMCAISTTAGAVSVVKQTGITATRLKALRSARFDLLPASAVSGLNSYSMTDVLASREVIIVRDGEDGSNGAFTQTVFKRSASKPLAPGGGTYTDSVPDGWTDAPESGQDPVWMSRAKITSDMTGASGKPVPNWSDPVPAVDSTDIEFIWSSKESPSAPSGHPFSLLPGGDWTKDADGAVWMAVAVKSNGAWSDWQIVRVKGEKGDKGDPGEDGENAVAFSLCPSVLQFKRKSPMMTFIYLDITDGNDRVKPEMMLSLTGSGSEGTITTGLTWKWFPDHNGRMAVRLMYDGTAAISLDKEITVEYNGKRYSHTLQIQTVADGEDGKDGKDGKDGEDGEDGKNAVTYGLTLSRSQVKYDIPLGRYDVASLTCDVMRTDGDSPAVKVATLSDEGLTLSYKLYDPDGSLISEKLYSGGVALSTQRYSAISFILKKDGVQIATQTVSVVSDGVQGLPGKTYKPMRVSCWERLDPGENLYEGSGDDDPWTDVFFLEDTDPPVYYQVIQSFVKKDSDTIAGLLAARKIRAASSFFFIATDLLLAKETFIQNAVVGKLMAAAASGERVIVDPALGNMRIFDSDGNLTATYGSAHRSVGDVIPKSLTSGANSASNSSMDFGLVNKQGSSTYVRKIAEKTVSGDGMLKVTIPSYSVSMTKNEANEGQGGVPRTSSHIYAYLFINGQLADSVDFGTVYSDSTLAYDTYQQTMSARMKDGDRYSVELYLRVGIGGGEYYDSNGKFHESSGGSVSAHAGGSMTAGYVATMYYAEFFGNGFAFSTNSDNYFYALFEDDVLKIKAVSGGNTIFSS